MWKTAMNLNKNPEQTLQKGEVRANDDLGRQMGACCHH